MVPPVRGFSESVQVILYLEGHLSYIPNPAVEVQSAGERYALEVEMLDDPENLISSHSAALFQPPSAHSVSLLIAIFSTRL